MFTTTHPSHELETGNLHYPLIDNNEDSPVQVLDRPPSSGSLINQLRAVTQSLPNSITIGIEDDVLAQFLQPLVVDPNECDDAWEMIDKILNGVIGYDMSVAGVTTIIRRGSLGMDGMCDWLEACISKHGDEHATALYTYFVVFDDFQYSRDLRQHYTTRTML